MKYKGFEIPDKEIDNIVEKGFSIIDACEMWLSDNGMIKDETVEELTAKAQKNRITSTIHKAKGEKKVKKTREKKENPLKKEIIQTILNGMLEKYPFPNWFVIKNDEKYIDFTIDGREFTINLVEHRKKKGE